MSNDTGHGTDNEAGDKKREEEYLGNIWGRKWSLISLIIIMIFLTIAVCRYLVIKPDRLIEPENIEELKW